MNISDIFSLLVIVFAIAAIVSEQNRTYVFKKFSLLNWIFIGVGFLHIHFLLAYDWFLKILPSLRVFNYENFPTPSVWAYIITLLLLGFTFYKIFFGFYPPSMRKKVIHNYNSLLMKGETAFLSDIIEKHHIKDIVEYLIRVRSIQIENPTGFWFNDNPKYDKEYKKKINTNRLKFAKEVYSDIILNDAFLDSVSVNNPRFFAPIIQELKTVDVRQTDFVNRYLKILMRNKNGFFFRELRNIKWMTRDDLYIIEDNTPIVFALFKDIKVAEVNEAWRGIADESILEMDEEVHKVDSPLRVSNNERDDDTLWTYRMQYAIHYFDIMIRQAISQNCEYHMWLLYYRNFVRAIIENMNDDSELNRSSRSFHMIESIIIILKDWKSVAIKFNNGGQIFQVLATMGDNIYSIAITPKLKREDKCYLINWLWEDIIRDTWASEGGETEFTKQILNEAFKVFLNPHGGYSNLHDSEDGRQYIEELNHMYNRRDIALFIGHPSLVERVDRFKREVIDKLNEESER
jgi:hypothetical protein